MAFLKEDSGFTHVIAIDFGTGASGYVSLVKESFTHSLHIDMVLLLR